jgi:hypothetical protein
VIDGLVAKGLVERRPVTGDRRRAELCLTSAGQAALASADGAVEHKLAAILDALDDPEDRRRATEGLEAWGRALAASGRASFGSASPDSGSGDGAGNGDRATVAIAGAAADAGSQAQVPLR